MPRTKARTSIPDAQARHGSAAAKLSTNAYYYALGATQSTSEAALFAAHFRELVMGYFNHKYNTQPVIENAFKIWQHNRS